MNKIDFLDNNLTKEQQEIMDEAYEALMSEVKVLDLRLYEKLRANELTIADVYKLRHSKEQKRMTRIIDDQYTLLWDFLNVLNVCNDLYYLDWR